VVVDYASRCCTKLAMARHVSGDPADDGAFDTSLGIRIQTASLVAVLGATTLAIGLALQDTILRPASCC
jgi:hypothetical protein